MVAAVSIYGPPGTGKTEYLIRESQFLFSHAPLKFLSHTRAAAEECVGRLGNKDLGSTIHALCFRLLNMGRKSVITPMRLQGFGDEIGIRVTGSPDEVARDEGDEYLAVINYARNVGQNPFECYDKFGRPGNAGNFAVFLSSYKSWKETYGFVDFNDMLEKFIKVTPKVDFKILMVDEAQDLSPLQWAVIDKIIPQLETIYIAGDDDQAIYTWGGADPRGMRLFDEKYKAERRILKQSYRVPRKVHSLAQQVIHRIPDRVEKDYSAAPRHGKVEYIASLENIDFTKPAVFLARDNYKIKDFERVLIAQQVPYEVRGNRGVLGTPYGKAMTVWRKIENGIPISEEDKRSLYVGVDDLGKKSVLAGDFQGLMKRGWISCIRMPYSSMDFFQNVDLTKEPIIYLSTIHGAKGTEADRVIVYTARSARVIESAEVNPDPEHRLFYVAATRAKETLMIIDGVDGYPYPMENRDALPEPCQ